MYNNTKLPKGRLALYKFSYDSKFIKQVGNDVLKVNYLASNNEMHCFESLHNTYYTFGGKRPGETHKADVNGVPYVYTYAAPLPPSCDDLVLLSQRKNYPDTLRFLIENLVDEDLTASVRAMYPEMMDYIKTLGVEKIAALKYRKKPVRDAYTNASK